ncbi:MAG: hypothetical protein HY327_08970 [Chloroflexi bacterium]|nr:hypothetical protein [Chloroflexota bacterium]
MQDRTTAVFILITLAVCCLGLYVAVSGFLINTPPSTTSLGPLSPVAQSTVIVLASATDTPRSISARPTAVAIPSPLGAFQTITAAVTAARPTATITPRVTVAPPTSLPAIVGAASCANFAFCPQGGAPDSRLAPTGAACPRNYIWGTVLDANGRGITDARLRFKGPLGDLETVASKGPPDPPGIYNILAPPPGGIWIIWMIDAANNRLSPDITVHAPQGFAGGGSCPTRVDFVQRR